MHFVWKVVIAHEKGKKSEFTIWRESKFMAIIQKTIANKFLCDVHIDNAVIMIIWFDSDKFVICWAIANIGVAKILERCIF